MGGDCIKTLYIIGNGFDIAHGLKTNYWEMRKYIEKKYPDFLYEFEKLYDIHPLDDTEPWYTQAAQERWDKAVNHNLWSAFEKCMGNPNTTEMLELSSSVTEGMPSVGVRYHMDSYWKEQFGFIKKLQNYVQEWIETIDTNNVKCKKKCLKNSNDFFFNFNYTDVLEKVYGIAEVLHIHGGVTSVCDLQPIMGHCNKQDILKHRRWAQEADEEFAEAEASIQDAVADYLQAIYKDTKELILLNRNFFDKLSAVNRVVVIGWAAGEVDIPYLQEIIRSVSRNTRWTVYWYNIDAYNSLTSAFEKEGIVDKNTIEFVQSDAFWDI